MIHNIVCTNIKIKLPFHHTTSALDTYSVDVALQPTTTTRLEKKLIVQENYLTKEGS